MPSRRTSKSAFFLPKSSLERSGSVDGVGDYPSHILIRKEVQEATKDSEPKMSHYGGGGGGRYDDRGGGGGDRYRGGAGGYGSNDAYRSSGGGPL